MSPTGNRMRWLRPERSKNSSQKTAGKSFSFGMLKRAVGYLAKDAPGIFPMTLLVAAMQAAYPYIGILLSAEILTELADPGRAMEHLFFLALALVGLNFLGKRLIDFCSQVLEVMKYTAMKHVVRTVAEKAWKMDYALSADPEINETKERITHWFYGRGIMALSRQLLNIFQALLTIAISAALVVEFFRARAVGEGGMAVFLNHWSAVAVFLVLMVFSIACSILSAARGEKIYREADEAAGKPMNQMNHLLESCFTQYQRGKDIRMFQAEGLFQDRLGKLQEEFAGYYGRAHQASRILRILEQFPARVFNLLVYLFVGLKALYGAFGVGSILKYTGMVAQIGNGISRLCDSFRYFFQNFENINTFFQYLDMPNRTADGDLPLPQETLQDYEFEFRAVTFTYPGAAAPSLQNVSCRFRKGEKIAIVGRNGSGKTTFIKLLCRLCDPDQGEILLNGVDIRRYKYEEYLKFFSTVFQDYQIFAFRLGENVAAESEYQEERVKKALEEAGFGERLASLEAGLHTQLFKRFSEEGVELSGGESQKVAIARCLYKDAPYVVMDEPTAALDPVAEAEIYQRMNRFTRDKGAIFISHRLSSCCFCDRVFVFEKGQLVEQGSHGELLAAEGRYRKLWDAQARYYA